MLVVGTLGIDPTIVRDQWQTNLLLKCRQAPGKNARVRLVFEKTAVAIPFLGRQLGISRLKGFTARTPQSLRVPPTIELEIAKGNALVTVTLHQSLQRAGVAETLLVVVPIRGAGVGPVAQVAQADVGVVGRPILSTQISQGSAPAVPCSIHPNVKGHQRPVREVSGQINHPFIEAAGDLRDPVPTHSRDHVIRRGRQHDGPHLIVEQEPWRSGFLECKTPGSEQIVLVAEVMQILRELREARKADGSGTGDRFFSGDAEKNNWTADVGPDTSVERHLLAPTEAQFPVSTQSVLPLR